MIFKAALSNDWANRIAKSAVLMKFVSRRRKRLEANRQAVRFRAAHGGGQGFRRQVPRLLDRQPGLWNIPLLRRAEHEDFPPKSAQASTRSHKYCEVRSRTGASG